MIAFNCRRVIYVDSGSLLYTINPQFNALGLNFDTFWVGAYSRGGFIRDGHIESFNICRIEISMSKLLFCIILKEQSKFKH